MVQAPEGSPPPRWASRVLAPPLAALQFLTLIPPIVRRSFSPAEMGRAVAFFPLTGALIGAVLAGLNRALAHVFSAGITAGLTLAAWVTITGALHLDGFLDSCDGLFGGHTPEKRLEIMHDERVGAFGLAGGVLLLLLKYAALVSTPFPAPVLFLAPALGRWSVSMAVIGFPYARSQGLGRTMKDHAGRTQALLATGVALAVAWLAASWLGLAALGLAGIVTWLAARFTLTRLPGLTGDLYGAICELVEMLILLLFAIEVLT